MYSKKRCKMKWALNYIPMFNIRIPVLTFSLALLEEDIAYLEVLNNDIADDVGFLTAVNSNIRVNCKN